jgi:serine/threonine protein kinase
MLSPSTRLGPYEIQSVIGVGGMGEVYQARDTKLNRDVAQHRSRVRFREGSEGGNP